MAPSCTTSKSKSYRRSMVRPATRGNYTVILFDIARDNVSTAPSTNVAIRSALPSNGCCSRARTVMQDLNKQTTTQASAHMRVRQPPPAVQRQSTTKKKHSRRPSIILYGIYIHKPKRNILVPKPGPLASSTLAYTFLVQDLATARHRAMEGIPPTATCRQTHDVIQPCCLVTASPPHT